MTGTHIKNLSYLVVGSGKLAKHICHYISLLNQNLLDQSLSSNNTSLGTTNSNKLQNTASSCSYMPINLLKWNRKENTINELKELTNKCTHVLLCISDTSLQNFIEENCFLKNKICVHFSGALHLPGVHCIHPLMSFTNTLYDFDFYKKIPFVVFHSNPTENINLFSDIFPSFPNVHYFLSVEKKELYHSLCVLSNNFTVLLWQKVFSEFKDKLGLPIDILMPYLEKTLHNILKNPNGALTGPLARKDIATIVKNIQALRDDSYQKVYESFVWAEFKDFFTSKTYKENFNEKHP